MGVLPFLFFPLHFIRRDATTHRRRTGGVMKGTAMFRNLTALGLVILAMTSPAFAFEMTPLELELDPAGRESSGSFRIVNIDARPIAVEVAVFTREMTEEGADILRPADGDFIVYPPQMIVMPGRTQTLRVQYIGDPVDGPERAYRLIAEQLPIDLGDDGQGRDGGSISLLVRYVASLYVGPPSAKPALRVIAAEPAPGNRMRVVLANEGSGHALLTNLKLRVGGRELADDAIAGLLGENILAGVTRSFLIPWPEGVARQPQTLELVRN